MNAQQAAEIQALLEGVDLPATRAALVRYAAREDPETALILEQRLPDREFDRIDAVAAALMRPPAAPSPPPKLPAPESGEPPGGDDYLRPFAEPGAVRPLSPERRPPQEVLEQQSATLKKQAARQRG